MQHARIDVKQVLETLGVAVVSYGSDHFPAFFSGTSGCLAPTRVDSPEQAAALITATHDLQLGSGIVIGAPSVHDADCAWLGPGRLGDPRLVHRHAQA